MATVMRKPSANSVAGPLSTVNSSTHGIMRALEGGMMLTRYSFRRRAEKRMFQVKLETRQLIWTRNVGSTRPDGSSEYITFRWCHTNCQKC
ncbi:hypothetical protein NP493_448g01031 [Ridgeia piscesae]|uniref:Uncharacterized protein n=1 Tax=Ridgeia piscesae TaxID=27915 RepID=A0AAD9KZJ4_RIDPI|nr:hypothetical protein NP493_448g01031 [Ridgeia piscesae]